MSEQEKREQRVIIAQGELAHDQSSTLARLLGLFGLSVQSMSTEEYEDFLARQHPAVLNFDPSEALRPNEEYRIDAITSKNNFLVREHFDDFHAIYCRDMSAQVKGRAFVNLFATHMYGRRYRLVEPISPASPQLLMRKREEVGIPPVTNETGYFYYSQNRQLLDYAIQAGSLVETFAALVQSPKLKKAETFLARMSLQLASQFQD